MIASSSHNQWNIVGHQSVTMFLSKALETNNIAHAYLLSGPAGVGKKTIVKEFIHQLLGPKAFFGAVTWIRREIDEKTGMPKRDITVAQIREMIRELRLTSMDNGYKVAVIADAEHLNVAASNSLLKILEEPSKKTIIFLTTSDSESVLETIRSRCQQLHCNLVERSTITDWLISFDGNRELSHSIAGYALGKPGYAHRLYYDLAEQQRISEYIDFFIAVHDQNISERLRTLDRLLIVADKEVVKQALLIWQNVFRDMLLYAVDSSKGFMYRTWHKQLELLVGRYSKFELCQRISHASELVSHINHNGNTRLSIESFIIKFV